MPLPLPPDRLSGVPEQGFTPNGVPPLLPLWKVRTILAQRGLLDQANDLVLNSNNTALINLWEYGNEVRRRSTTLEALATALGITSAQLDQMFIEANSLSV